MRDKQSDKVFFEQLYQDYEQKIFYRAYTILNNKGQAEDITQDVFEQLYVDRKKIRKLNELHLKKYILVIVKNKAIDRYRKNQTQTNYLKDYYTDSESNNNVTDYLDDLLSEDNFDEITQVLDVPYRQVFIYRVFYGLNTKETAMIMNVSEPTIRKQYERAKNKIKSLIGGQNQHDNTKK